jgi:hypothetical protein
MNMFIARMIDEKRRSELRSIGRGRREDERAMTNEQMTIEEVAM